VSNRVRLNVSHPATIRAKQRAGVKGRMIGRGYTTAVYQNDDGTVSKLTCDPTHYDLMRFYENGSFCPNVISDLGVLGETRDDHLRKEVPVFGYVSELLYPCSGSNYDLAEDLADFIDNLIARTFVKNEFGDSTYFNRKSVAALMNFCDNRLGDFPDFVYQGLDNVLHFLLSCPNATLDLHEANMMERADGTFAFSDPVVVI
jgi:hypothetical protein